ncbi:exo-alpha-sialidase [Streptomyces sp. RG80]|uniref:WD40/YVTN/BNR-like repeat-containing protein n=1 Tax=Streptomyces sp. RG80 TaxID=3157340 RepID=UPI00338F8A78
MGFASDGSGFALLAECGKARCVQRVAVLEKGARAWRPVTSPLPDVTGDLGITAGLVVLGPGRALITEGKWPPPDRTWFTSDGGSSWRRSTNEPAGTTPRVPEGGALVQDCTGTDEEGNGCAASRLLAVVPDTGEYRVLATQPPLEGIVTPAGRTPGRLFASGLDPRSGRPTLAVSEDRGASWRTLTLATGPEQGWGMTVVTDGSVLYAAQSGQLLDEDGVKNGLLSLHRSTDGGLTWERTWRHRKGAEPRSLLGAPIAAADGSLTVHGEDGAWRSTDGGRSFARAGARGPSGWVSTTPLGYLWGDSFGAGRWRISADGVRWTTFDLGDGP